MGSDDSDDTCVGTSRIAPMRHASDGATARRRRIVGPDHLAGRRVERRDGAESGADVQQAADHQRRVLRAARRRHGVAVANGVGDGRLPPGNPQVGYVVLRDLVQRRVLAARLVSRVGAPLAGGRPRLRMKADTRPKPDGNASRGQHHRGNPGGSNHAGHDTRNHWKVCFSDDWKIDGVQACTRKRGMARWRHPPGYTELSMPPPEPGDDERSGSRPQAAHGAARRPRRGATGSPLVAAGGLGGKAPI